METTERECIAALREAAERLGESPTKSQYEALGLQPASATIMRVMGGWNDAKEAAGLETYRSSGSRVGPKPDDVDLPEGTSWADLSVDQRWHYRHTEENNRRSLERRAELRAWLYQYRRDAGGCARCEETDPACIEFHHPPGVEKEATVNRMVPDGYSRADIEAEVEKCVLLCANCHRKEHYERPVAFERTGTEPDRTEGDEPPAVADVGPDGELSGRDRLRMWSYEYRRAVGCRRCDETDAACLQFHHPEGVEKVDGVGQMISSGYSESDVVAEVGKCTVLCANCHRKEHHERPHGVGTEG